MDIREEGDNYRKTTEKENPIRIDRKETENRQKEDRKKTEPISTGSVGHSKWMVRIEEGRKLPNTEHPDYKKFLKSWRGWYFIACTSLEQDTAAKNQYYYDKGKEHLESLNIRITEIPHTGSVQICTPKVWGEDHDANESFSYEVA